MSISEELLVKGYLIKGKIKKHFIEHKELYIGIGVGVGICATALAIYMLTREEDGDFYQTVSGDKNKVITNLIKNSDHVSIVTTYLERRGHPGNMVRCLETGEIFASQNRAAELMDIAPSTLSKHLAGLKANASGFHFENLGEAGSILAE